MKQNKIFRLMFALVLAFCAGTTASAYDLTTGTLTNCTVAFSGDGVSAGTPPTATAASTVTITVTPNAGYATKGITVKAFMNTGGMQARNRANEIMEDIEPTATDDPNVFTIVMPAAHIVVDATTTKVIQDTWIQDIDPVTYTGSTLTPTVTVKDGETTLVENTHYTVAYSNNTAAALSTAVENAPTVTITGIGDYSGTATKTFTIQKATATISYATAELTKAFGDAAFTNALSNTPAEGTDGTGLGTATYAVTAENLDEGCTSEHVVTVDETSGQVTITGTGTATITATVTDGTNYTYSGMAGYNGTEQKASVSYTLTVGKGTITASARNRGYTYDGNGHSITVNVTKPSSGYTIQYSTDNSSWSSNKPSMTDVGGTTIYYKVTAPNYNDYTSSAYVSISMAPGSISFGGTEVTKTYGDANFTKTYDSKTGDGSISYSSDNTDVATVNASTGEVTIKIPGTARITVSMAQSTNYTGASAYYTLTVDPKAVAASMIGEIADQTYTGGPLTPEVEVKDGETTLVAGTDYTVAYTNNIDPGQAMVTITGSGNYTGTASTTFTIVNNAAPDTEDEASITIGSTGKSTFVSNRDVDFTNSTAEAYIAVGYNATDKLLTLGRIYKVPAGTPVMVKGISGVLNVPFTSGVTYEYQNLFEGNTSGKTVEIGETDGGNNNYVMKSGEFQPVVTNAYIPTGKAYLQLPGSFPSAVPGSALNVTLTASGKSTLCSTVDLDFTDVAGIKAYAATGYDKVTKIVMLSRVLKASAGTPLVLHGKSNTTYTIPSSGVQTVYVNLLVGNNSGAAITVDPTEGSMVNYYLGSGEFKAVVDYVTVPDGKCYLQLPGAAAARILTRGAEDDYQYEMNDEIITIRLNDSETTCMEGLLKAAAEQDVYYNLNGQRTENPGKGIYLQQGRKVVIK